MATKPETLLTKRIRSAVLKAYPGSVVWKIHGGPMQRAGLPDLLGCVEGHLIALEVKMPGGTYGVTRLQAATLAAIDHSGGIAWVVTSPEEALERLAQGLNAPLTCGNASE